MRCDKDMKTVNFGRRSYAFSKGTVELTSTHITENSVGGEEEKAFSRRLMKMHGHREGTIEITLKRGRPDYAIVTFE